MLTRHAALGVLVALGHQLGERALLLRGEQRHLADLLEIHAHGVVRGEGVGHGVGIGELLLGDLLDLLDLLELGHHIVERRERIVAGGVDVQTRELFIELLLLLGRELQLLERGEILRRELAGLLALFDELLDALLLGLGGLVPCGLLVGGEQSIGHGLEFFGSGRGFFFLRHTLSPYAFLC